MNLRREQLLGYLLGALESAEMEQVENELEQSPALRVEMAKYQELLDRLGMDGEREHFHSPPDLAQKTCELVGAKSMPDRLEPAELVPARLTPAPVWLGLGEFSSRYTLTDILAVAAMALVAAALLFPSLSNMRFQADRALCELRLIRTGSAMWDFAQTRSDGTYPVVPEHGNLAVAGAIPVEMADRDLITEHLNIVCPSSDLGQSPQGFCIPKRSEVVLAGPQVIKAIQKTMGGSFAYNMGYLNGGRLVPSHRFGREFYALVGDVAPAPRDKSRPPHGGRGFNVLYEDGHVRFIPNLTSASFVDNPYCNRLGQRAAGTDINDASLGASDASPLPVLLPASTGPR